MPERKSNGRCEFNWHPQILAMSTAGGHSASSDLARVLRLTEDCGPLSQDWSARMPAVNRRTLLQSISAAAALLPRAAWATPNAGKSESAQSSSEVYELRVYHVAPGKLPDLLARFRDHTIEIFEHHGIESVGYWTPVDEPEKSNTLIYILRHPSREAAEANWKSFRDDPEWQSVRDKSEANGKLVEKVDSTFMALTTFSPRSVAPKV